MRRVETIFLTDEELNAFKIVQKILDDLDFSNWTTDAHFVQEVATGTLDIVATGVVDIDVEDDSSYHSCRFQIKRQ